MGNFFAIDRGGWNRAVQLGMNCAVAYLVMARGTGADQVTTSWSANAIETNTSIPRHLAKKSIAKLNEAGLITTVKSGLRPQYKLHQPEERDLIFLPNAIIDGASHETSPVELLRQSHNIDSLFIFVLLYASQNLPDDGGIEWRPSRGIRREYQQEHLGEVGRWKVLGFNRARLQISKNADFAKHHIASVDELRRFTAAIELLISLGLVFEVEHLVDAYSDDGVVMHPLPLSDRDCEPGEYAITGAVIDAISELPQDYMLHRAGGCDAIVPVAKHYSSVSLVGILRLRYRPQTTMTASWLEQSDEWEDYRTAYAEIQNEFKGLQYQGISRVIKDIQC